MITAETALPQFCVLCGDMLAGAEAVFGLRLIGSTLSLLYSTIDALAFYSMPETNDAGQVKTRAGQHDFTNWVQHYLLVGSDLPCTPLEIYAARCAWVHRHGFESNFTRRGVARILLYAWGQSDVWALQKALFFNPALLDRTIAIDLRSLLNAVDRGARQLINDFHATPDRLPLLARRLTMGPAHVPTRRPAGPTPTIFPMHVNIGSENEREAISQMRRMVAGWDEIARQHRQ